MHLNKEEIEQSIAFIAHNLKECGKFLFSVPIQRNDVDEAGKDENGRHFTIMSKREWVSLCERCGFTLKQSIINDDGLDREGIIWLTYVMER